jgi:hypothetical protein
MNLNTLSSSSMSVQHKAEETAKGCTEAEMQEEP